MKITDIITEAILTERATGILFHYTSIHAVNKMLDDGAIKLTASSGSDVERKYELPGYPYYLSTTRSKVGDYHRFVGSTGVMLVLDGDWFNRNNYPSRPVDYWYSGKTQDTLKRGEWKTIEPYRKMPAWAYAGSDRTRESEDRIYSKTNAIPLDPILAMHVLVTEFDERFAYKIRQMLIKAKTRGIKTYLYNDKSAWKLQDTRKTISIKQAAGLISGAEPSGRYYSRPARGVGSWGRSSLLDWIELIRKKPGQELSKSADKLRYNLTYYDTTIDNDLVNARKPNSKEYDLSVKIVDFMNKNNMSTVDLKNFLKNKWTRR